MDDKQKYIFIILRHVTNSETNKYWFRLYKSIRKLHPTIKIIIIDDNSPYKPKNIPKLQNCKIIHSEYHKRGELLPYYYFHKYKFSEKAIILHDSIILNKCFDEDIINNVGTYKFIWHFDPCIDFSKNRHDILKILEKLQNKNKIIELFNSKTFVGCFGGMSIITWDFIDKINEHFNFFQILLNNIHDRITRTYFERIFACVCICHDDIKSSLFGDIFEWTLKTTKGRFSYGISNLFYVYNIKHLDKWTILKIWTGR